MDIRRRTAAALAGLTLLIGGTAAGCTTTSDNADDAPQPAQTGAPPGRAGNDTTALVTALASTFSLDEETVQTAVDDAMSSVVGRGGGSGGQPPSDGQGQPPSDSAAPPSARGSAEPGVPDEGRLAEQLAASIATALSLDEAEVLTVVEANLPQRGDPGQGGPGDRGSDGDQNAPNPQPTTTG
ncbi:MAG: hypothetical protein KIT69_03100 [Propionibacteriaceae bacterium]|nr:hypothetical protein [Propionibacteriaceae bacterium]